MGDALVKANEDIDQRGCILEIKERELHELQAHYAVLSDSSGESAKLKGEFDRVKYEMKKSRDVRDEEMKKIDQVSVFTVYFVLRRLWHWQRWKRNCKI